MFTVKVICPAKLIAARGDRSRSDVAANGGGQFTEQDLYNWEKGNNLPTPRKVPYLLAALGVEYDEVTVDVGRATANT